MEAIQSLVNVFVDFFSNGVMHAAWWEIVLYTLFVTHITIAGVTIWLHRCQAHRSLDLGPIPAHFFRFWMWLTTGMVTKEWAAIHRKHHAKCETVDDPHSPVTRGIKAVLLTGSEMYRAEAKNQETIAKFGHGTPDDWIERNLYSRFQWQGVALMMIINLALFGAIGATVWAIQMLWIPITAAGIINGIGHWWGYRNFEATDASRNIVPWGIIIGGEELHNNHHTYPTSAKLSVKPYEFDIAWGYIRAMEILGMAKVRKVAPQMRTGDVRAVADNETLEAVIANRYEVMAKYARELRRACATELAALRHQGAENSPQGDNMRIARRWLHRDVEKIPGHLQAQVADAAATSPALAKLVAMREELRALWTRTNVSAEQAVTDLQVWCKQAEESGIEALREFSFKLRAAKA
jgi:stearoyl-CoA desaturase (delta-9 desaturase)